MPRESVNLKTELAQAWRNIGVADWQRLKELGCAEGFAGLEGGGIGVEHIEGDESRALYHPGGKLRAFIVPIMFGAALVNLLAWRPGRGGLLDRVWMREEGICCLGQPAIAKAIRHAAPLKIYRSPRTWACNGRDGIVIGDRRCDLRDLLPIAEIAAEDTEHADEIARRLKRARFANLPPMPAVTVAPLCCVCKHAAAKTVAKKFYCATHAAGMAA